VVALLEGFTAAFLVAFVAELGDKTQLAVLALSAGNGDRKAVFLGAFCGLGLAIGAAVLLGGLITGLVDAGTLRLLAGTGFVAFAAYTYFSRGQREEEACAGAASGSVFVSALALLFVMEIGDKTQLANMLLAATYPPAAVFAGALLAEGLVAAITVTAGAKIAERVGGCTLRKASAGLFALVGLATLASLA
jgi:putative Ca2+/H+ antiporter (TMEM165/GDT1 family)